MTASFVYFIAAGEHRIKIGWSTNPERRLRNLQVGSCERLTPLAQVPGGAREERALHALFAAHHLNGEWFSLHDDIWVEIDRLLAGGSIKVSEADTPAREREPAAGWRQFLKDRHPRKTANEISARTGISAHTVEKWFRGTSPSFEAILLLCAEYGPEFASTCRPSCVWLADLARSARKAAFEESVALAQGAARA